MNAPSGQSYLSWMFQSLGPFYALVLPLVGLALFAGGCLVVGLSRRRSVIAAYLVFLPLPLMIGVYGSIQGLIASYSVIATAGATPKPAHIAAGVSTALFTSLVGLGVTFPSYLVVAAGLFARTVFRRGEPSD